MTKNVEVSFTLENSVDSNTTQHQAILGYLMSCTGIHRITVGEDVYELFKRACLLFPNLHFSKGYRKQEDLFYFNIDGKNMTFEVGHLKDCMHTFLSDTKEDKLNFFDWLDRFMPDEEAQNEKEFETNPVHAFEQQQTCFLSDISGNPLKTELQSNLQWPLSETTQKNAEFFAQQLLPYLT